MSWDIALNNRHTLRGGIVTGDDEILQRLWIRLNKELGEWFLNTETGLPWYQGGYGMLGAKPSRKNEIDLLIRQEIANTQGVLQILKYKTLYASGTRLYDAYCSILLQSRRTVDISFGVEMQSGGSGMPVIPASFIRFSSGKTLQDLYDSGELQGPEGLPGTPGDDGVAATIVIGSTTSTPSGSEAYVINSGDENHAVLEFGIPYGAKGDDGKTATITVGSTVTGGPGTPASVTNSGTEDNAILDFVIPQGEGASVAIEGGPTIDVTEVTENGIKTFNLEVVDNAHAHIIDNVDGLAEALANVSSSRTATADNVTVNETRFFKFASYDHPLPSSVHGTPGLYSTETFLVQGLVVNTSNNVGLLRIYISLIATSNRGVALSWPLLAMNNTSYAPRFFGVFRTFEGRAQAEFWYEAPALSGIKLTSVASSQTPVGVDTPIKFTLHDNLIGTPPDWSSRTVSYTEVILNRSAAANFSLQGDVEGSSTTDKDGNVTVNTHLAGGWIK